MTNPAQIESLLTHHHVRKTKIRIAVLDLFLHHSYALSHAEIEQHIGQQFDRVTIYRTLKSFEEQGLIHRVIDDSGAMKFAICSPSSNCQEHQHHDQHIHFNCNKCGKTFCLDSVPIPHIELPPNYQFEKLDLLAQGVCKDCL
jgi:Fur family transcriptional regulator, ferric uptake regulator